mgnify:FL=1
MIIKSIRIKGFKGFKDEYYIEFDDKQTIIEGENFQGKTSIGEAICWCFLGTNLFGNDKTINIINNSSNTAYCELKFLDNDMQEHTIVRSKGKENIVVLDGQKASVEILSKFYYEKKVFLSVYNPYYFSSLEPKEQRELLRSILPNIDYRAAFNLLSQTEREILVEPRMDLNGFIKSAREELKGLSKDESNLEGKRQYANSIVVSHIGEEKEFEQEGMLAALEREYEMILKSISGDTKKEMKIRLEELDKRIENHNKLLEDLRTKYKDSKEILDSIKRDNSICPVCNSKILDEGKIQEIVISQTKILQQITEEGKTQEAELKNLKAQRNILDIKCNTLNPNTEKEELLNKLQEKISRLKLEKEDVQKNNYEVQTRRKAVEKAKYDIEIIEKALEEVKGTQIILNNQISTATSLNNLIIKKQMERVSQYLDRVELVFSKVDKTTGEVKDDYKIFYDGKEYNVLSLSEKIRATLEISNLINKMVGLNAPTFIDNSESITHYNNNFDNQIILAKVVEGKELHINNELSLDGRLSA